MLPFMPSARVQRSSRCAQGFLPTSEAALPPSPTRVRLVLYPGQIVGLDSEEGRSVNLTCGEDAATMLLDVGERDKLVALQSLALPNDLAKSP